MNRDDLINRLAERTGEYKYTIENFVKNYENIIEECLLNGEDVHLHGFITFQVKEHSEKMYVNPKTKESKVVLPSKKIKIRVSKTLNNKL